jgi:hypothetical protein
MVAVTRYSPGVSRSTPVVSHVIGRSMLVASAGTGSPVPVNTCQGLKGSDSPVAASCTHPTTSRRSAASQASAPPSRCNMTVSPSNSDGVTSSRLLGHERRRPRLRTDCPGRGRPREPPLPPDVRLAEVHQQPPAGAIPGRSSDDSPPLGVGLDSNTTSSQLSPTPVGHSRLARRELKTHLDMQREPSPGRRQRAAGQL